MALEEEFDIEISDDKAETFYRVCDVMTFISSRIGNDQDTTP
jgi:acyl carrier protein